MWRSSSLFLRSVHYPRAQTRVPLGRPSFRFLTTKKEIPEKETDEFDSGRTLIPLTSKKPNENNEFQITPLPVNFRSTQKAQNAQEAPLFNPLVLLMILGGGLLLYVNRAPFRRGEPQVVKVIENRNQSQPPVLLPTEKEEGEETVEEDRQDEEIQISKSEEPLPPTLTDAEPEGPMVVRTETRVILTEDEKDSSSTDSTSAPWLSRDAVDELAALLSRHHELQQRDAEWQRQVEALENSASERYQQLLQETSEAQREALEAQAATLTQQFTSDFTRALAQTQAQVRALHDERWQRLVTLEQKVLLLQNTLKQSADRDKWLRWLAQSDSQLRSLQEAVKVGGDVSAPRASLLANTVESPLLHQVTLSVPEEVPSLTTLQRSLEKIDRRSLVLQNANETAGRRAWEGLKATVGWDELSPLSDDPLSRAQFFVRRGNVLAARQELTQLPEAPELLVWQQQADRWIVTHNALEVIEAELHAQRRRL